MEAELDLNNKPFHDGMQKMGFIIPNDRYGYSRVSKFYFENLLGSAQNY